MIDQHKASLFKELLSQAESVLVIYAPDALRDHLFAATALYKTLQLSTPKEVLLLSSEDLSKDESDIVYLSETKTEIGHKNLCISFDYSKEAVEKITSSIDEESNKLHITIKPQKGSKPLSQESVSFSYTGAEADMVILVGVDDLESLEQLYIGYENLYQSTALVSINSYETTFGNLKIDILGSSCVSEYTAGLLQSLGYDLDQEVATNLLAAIDEETDKLESYLATADTFETVAQLLRAGARRFAREPQEEDLGFENQQHSVSQNFNFNQSDESDTQNQEEEIVVVTDETDQEVKQEKNIDQKSQKKKKRGRPKGSKNKKYRSKKKKSKHQNNSDVSSNAKNKNSQSKKQDAPKPGDLNYTPSGYGPTGG